MNTRVSGVLLALAVVASGLLGGVSVAAEPLGSGGATPGATPMSGLGLTPVTFGEYQFTEVTFAITVDAVGLLERSDEAEAAAAAALEPFFAQLATCNFVFGLISSGGERQFAIDTSSLVAETIILNFPEIVGRGSMQRFSLDDPNAIGHVELVLWFDEGCGSARSGIPPALSRMAA
ncbi:MAG: hypothetical protein KF883_17090 [Thermomicrobiales bacterium]|nr:hypothetical protein [Thermomicrobiales bacterium]